MHSPFRYLFKGQTLVCMALAFRTGRKSRRGVCMAGWQLIICRLIPCGYVHIGLAQGNAVFLITTR